MLWQSFWWLSPGSCQLLGHSMIYAVYCCIMSQLDHFPLLFGPLFMPSQSLKSCTAIFSPRHRHALEGEAVAMVLQLAQPIFEGHEVQSLVQQLSTWKPSCLEGEKNTWHRHDKSNWGPTKIMEIFVCYPFVSIQDPFLENKRCVRTRKKHAKTSNKDTWKKHLVWDFQVFSCFCFQFAIPALAPSCSRWPPPLPSRWHPAGAGARRAAALCQAQSQRRRRRREMPQWKTIGRGQCQWAQWCRMYKNDLVIVDSIGR